MSGENTIKEIFMSEEEFNKLRSDFRFARILTLARVCNALEFCFTTARDYSEDRTTKGSRQMINSLMFSMGVLYEGFKVVDNLEKHFGDKNSFKKGFGKLLNDKEVKDLREKHLRNARDTFIFHYDNKVFSSTILETLDLPEYVFATMQSPKYDGIYFNLADSIPFNYLTKDAQAKDKINVIIYYHGMLGKIIHKYKESANFLIKDVLEEKGWQIREKSD